MSTLKQLDLVMSGGAVKRFHVMPTLKEESVAQHSFLVAWLVTIIEPNPSANLLLACLQHDLAEVATGDIPSTSKRRFNLSTTEFEAEILKDAGHKNYVVTLSDCEKRLLKVADIFSGMLFCLNEIIFGNSHPQLRQTFDNYRSYLEVYRSFSEPEQQILDWIYSKLPHPTK